MNFLNLIALVFCLANSELSNFLGLHFPLVLMFPWGSTMSCGLLVAMSLFLSVNGLDGGGARGASLAGTPGTRVNLDKVRA